MHQKWNDGALKQLQHPGLYDQTFKEDQHVLEAKSVLEELQRKVHIAL